ncbi:MAG: CDP-alcohol phosphatidyltransferase family protein [Candidatus Aminicenantia bacterium]
MRITFATKITLLRFFLTPLLIFYIGRKDFKISLIIFVFAAITDGLDGMIARKFNQRTSLGAILDPASDKALMLSTFFMLSLIANSNRIPKWLFFAILARDLIIVFGALFLTFFYHVKTFSPSIWGKLTTGVEAFTAGLALLGNYLCRSIIILVPFYYLALCLVIISGIDYTVKGISVMRRRT